MIRTPTGGQSGFTGEETKIALVGLFHSLFSREPLQGVDVVGTHDGQLSGTCDLCLLTPSAFSGAFVVENESFLAGAANPRSKFRREPQWKPF